MSHTYQTPAADGNPLSEDRPIKRQVPSLRNRDIFAAVVMGKSHAEAAEEFKLTQPRVTQIVEQVRDWISQVSRGEDSGYTEIQQLRVAEETLRIQLDGWMRMAMQEWFQSCQEGLGRTTFLNQAARLSINLARLAGVDVTGKTARAKAEQQAREEAQKRLEAAEKTLWGNQQKSPAAPAQPTVSAASTPVPADVCARQTIAEPPTPTTGENEKKSYGSGDPVACISLPLMHPTPAPTPPVPVDKPIPKFLDKNVRKRLLALRRERARSATLEAVG